jgi:hypothetical protein
MPIWGEVTYDGKPLETGTIELIPIDGTPGPSTGGAITNGQYDVPQNIGPRTGGTYQVAHHRRYANRPNGAPSTQPLAEDRRED